MSTATDSSYDWRQLQCAPNDSVSWQWAVGAGETNMPDAREAFPLLASLITRPGGHFGCCSPYRRAGGYEFDTTRAADCVLLVASLCVGVRRRHCFASLRAAWALVCVTHARH
jgi:hypothetical protein